MAVTKIWRIRGKADDPLSYVADPEKTQKEFTEEEQQALADVIAYAANEDKTDQLFYTSGINCNVDFARDQFDTAKIRFGKPGGIVALHAYQSFREGEVTPDEAHAIGVELARELWGERFQCVVATHLNTSCVHNHIVINSVSFRDGKKFHMCTQAYRDLMSTYYDFYAARVTDEDMIEAIGPYVRFGEENRLVPIVSRSRSFIHWDEFGAWVLPVSKIPEYQQEFFTDEGWNDDERHSISYFMTYDEVVSMAGDGLIRGYVTLNELDVVTRSNYDPDTIWGLWVRSPETIAEMDAEMRKQYGHIAFIDRSSTEYICRQLIEAVDPIEYSIERSKLCFIVRVC